MDWSYAHSIAVPRDNLARHCGHADRCDAAHRNDLMNGG